MRIKDKYISPFTDFGFKKLFGTEPNKDILMDFLNELLKKETGMTRAKRFLIFIVKIKKGKSLLLNCKKPNKITSKIAVFTIPPFPFSNKPNKENGILD